MTKTLLNVVRQYLTTEKFKIPQHQRNDDNQMREKYVTSLTSFLLGNPSPKIGRNHRISHMQMS